MKKKKIKIFSHNDLDGFGAPILIKMVQPYIFKNIKFELTTCSISNIEKSINAFLNSNNLSEYKYIYIMDMTPNKDYIINKIKNHFKNNWLIFDHHESSQNIRKKYKNNCINTLNTHKKSSATSLAWNWISIQSNFKDIPLYVKRNLYEISELIRAYDTWDWQNDKNMSNIKKRNADELNQLFWFYPLNQSQQFIEQVYQTGWEKYRIKNILLINTLKNKRDDYIKKHLKNAINFHFMDLDFKIVYATKFKSEIAHTLLSDNIDIALVVDSHNISLRSKNNINVSKIAQKLFNGGGHVNAAGGTLPINPIKIGEQKLIENITQKIQNITIHHINN